MEGLLPFLQGGGSEKINKMKTRQVSLSEISEILNIPLTGKDRYINGLNLCNKTSIHDSIITYITSSKFIRFLRHNPKVKAVILNEEIYEPIRTEFADLSFFIASYPEDKFYDLHTYLYDSTSFYDHFNFLPVIGEGCKIHSTAVVENGVVLGKNVTVGQYSVIKTGVTVGSDSIIGCGTVLGSEGFQLIHDHKGKNRLIRHAGGCRIGERVGIGDNTTVCKSLFEDTLSVGNDTKIDNLVHIAHNCVIGKNCVITAGVILSGSTIIGDNVWLAPNSAVSNKVSLGNNSFVGTGSVVIKKVNPGIKVFGNPAKEI
jgi:UDP-3-O-[3-hydroxymyristoyl] glucosamine N-acyltransferase